MHLLMKQNSSKIRLWRFYEYANEYMQRLIQCSVKTVLDCSLQIIVFLVLVYSPFLSVLDSVNPHLAFACIVPFHGFF